MLPAWTAVGKKLDIYMPVKGKCTWWREIPHEEDAYDIRLKDEDKRVRCSCFVEGDVWVFKTAEIPSDCPKRLHCRYYIKNA